MPRVTIAIGSNLGDRHQLLEAAIRHLKQLSSPARIFLQARPIETLPQCCPEGSPLFLNTVVDFDYSPKDPFLLLSQTQKIETKLGRTSLDKRSKNAPRLIDLDILYFGSITLDHPDLKLPHPRISERKFVTIPLLEIRPDLAKNFPDCP